MIPTLIAISVIVFVIIQLPPGDYLESHIATMQAQGESIDQKKIAFLREQYGLQPRFEPFEASGPERRDWPDAVLLIGDKVVRSGPGTDTHPHQLDLGEAWRELTGLPFVFASWFRRAGATGDELERARRLAVLVDHARRRNRHRIASIAKQHAPSHGWDIAQAIEYLGTRLCYECTPRSIEAIRTFLEAASTVSEPGAPAEPCPPLRIAADVMAST